MEQIFDTRENENLLNILTVELIDRARHLGLTAAIESDLTRLTAKNL